MNMQSFCIQSAFIMVYVLSHDHKLQNNEV